MKNRRAFAMMGLAIVLGLAAVVLASRWLLRQAPGAARIVVAAADVNLGQRLAADMGRLADWPSGSVPDGVLRDPQLLSGRVLRTSVQRGEPLTEAKLAPVGTLGGLSALIAEGRRAMTVRVNDVVGVAGFALPGNFVDILVNTQAEGEGQGRDNAISKIVLERILVLAVAQEVSRDDTKPRVVNAVTLEVTPGQAERLDLARSVGTLSLVLRNQVDPRPGVTAGATKHLLLARADAAVPLAFATDGASSLADAASASVGADDAADAPAVAAHAAVAAPAAAAPITAGVAAVPDSRTTAPSPRVSVPASASGNRSGSGSAAAGTRDGATLAAAGRHAAIAGAIDAAEANVSADGRMPGAVAARAVHCIAAISGLQASRECL